MSSPMPALTPRPAASAVPGRATRPTLRLLHHMARSGGTLISKCLGCMSGVRAAERDPPARHQPLQSAGPGAALVRPAVEPGSDRAQGARPGRLRRRDRADPAPRRGVQPAAGDPRLEPPRLHRRAVRRPAGASPPDRRGAGAALRAAPGLHRAPPAGPVAEPQPARGGPGPAHARRLSRGLPPLRRGRQGDRVPSLRGPHPRPARGDEGAVRRACSCASTAASPRAGASTPSSPATSRAAAAARRSSRCRVGQRRRTCWRHWRRTRTTAPASSCSATSTRRTDLSRAAASSGAA